MSASTAQYNPSQVTVKVDGYTITDPSDSNVADIAPVGTAGKFSYGCDGGATFVGDSIRGVTVKISVRQNTNGSARLWSLLSAQMNQTTSGQNVSNLNVVIFDASSGSTVRGKGRFTVPPNLTYAKEDTMREYTLELPLGLNNTKELASPS